MWRRAGKGSGYRTGRPCSLRCAAHRSAGMPALRGSTNHFILGHCEGAKEGGKQRG